MSLTFQDNGTSPIAKITSPGTARYVYLSMTPSPPNSEISETSSILDEPLDEKEIEMISQALREGTTLRGLIEDLSEEKDAQSTGETCIQLLPGENIFVMPAPESERVMIGGESGCGKSTLAALYATLWKEMFPEDMIYLFARQEDDPAFQNIEHEEIVVNEDLIYQKLDLDDFSNSLVIFDDMDNLQDKRLLKRVHDLMGDLMSNGRKKNIWVVYLTHILLNRSQTKVPLNESNKVIFFNGCGARQNINFLKSYAGLLKPQIDLLTNLPSRWIMLSRKMPRYVIHEKGIFLL